NLELGLALHRVRAAFDPLDRLFPRFHLEDPEAADQVFGLRKRPVDDRALGSREPHARALRARMEPFAGEEHAMTPASEFLSAFTSTMNRTVFSPFQSLFLGGG